MRGSTETAEAAMEATAHCIRASHEAQRYNTALLLLDLHMRPGLTGLDESEVYGYRQLVGTLAGELRDYIRESYFNGEDQFPFVENCGEFWADRDDASEADGDLLAGFYLVPARNRLAWVKGDLSYSFTGGEFVAKIYRKGDIGYGFTITSGGRLILSDGYPTGRDPVNCFRDAERCVANHGMR